jgi:FAD-linked sulfhydryl oxidase
MEKEAGDENCGTCTDFKDWFNKKTEETKAKPGAKMSESDKNTTTTTPPPASKESTTSKTEQSYYNECPLFRNQLGNASWKYLHTMAAYYPASPTEEQKTKMTQFINTFAETFPCTHCGSGFKKGYVFMVM